jgi:hypothetical protein
MSAGDLRNHHGSGTVQCTGHDDDDADGDNCDDGCDDNDEVCAELWLLQRELRAQHAANERAKRELCGRVQVRLDAKRGRDAAVKAEAAARREFERARTARLLLTVRAKLDAHPAAVATVATTMTTGKRQTHGISKKARPKGSTNGGSGSEKSAQSSKKKGGQTHRA